MPKKKIPFDDYDFDMISWVVVEDTFVKEQSLVPPQTKSRNLAHP